MAEIILPPEENEETPQTPELNIDKPTENSKIITIEFEAKKTNKVSTKDTNQQLYTTDTDAWFEFKETSLEGANGTYSVVFRNRHDGSIFQRTGDVVDGVVYYKIPHQEIRHAGAWRGQIVYTLSNGDTTSREFDYDVKGHILDGKDVREIVVEDFETLMAQFRSMKDNAELELANLVNTVEQNESERQQFYRGLVEDIDDLQANYQELLDTGVLQTNINTKLEALEEEYAPKLTEVTAQLAQTQEQIQSVASGSPKGTYATLIDLQTAYPTGASGVYVVLSDGKWYYWKDVWTAGGVYQATSSDQLPASNRVANGNFANGMTGWNSIGGTSVASGGTATLEGNGTSNATHISRGVGSRDTSHKYYSKVMVRAVTSGVSRIQLDNSVSTTIESPVLNEWYEIESLNLAASNSSYISIFLRTIDAASSLGEKIEIKNVLEIDLTEVFGEGNEPSIEEVRTMLDRFPNKWFEGTVSLFDGKQIYNDIEVLKSRKVGEMDLLPDSVTKDKIPEKSIPLDKLTDSVTSKNIFNGKYEKYQLWGPLENPEMLVDENSRTAVVPIKPNESYSISVYGETDSFRVATSVNPPNFNNPSKVFKPNNFLIYNAVGRQFSFTNNATDNYLYIKVSSSGQEPLMQVEKGLIITEYVPHKILNKQVIPKEESETPLLPIFTNTEMIPIPIEPRFIEFIDGKLWGYSALDNGGFHFSTDEGKTWTAHTTSWNHANWGWVDRLIPTSDGEMLAMSEKHLRKSSGWSTGTVTWSENKVTPQDGCVFPLFGFDGDGNKFIIVEYGQSRPNWPNSRFVHISLDAGETFSATFDTLERHGEELNALTHLHAACYDRWADRFYFSEGHSPAGGLYYSEDDGATWHQASGHRDGVLESQGVVDKPGDTNGPTVIIATDDGLVMGSDHSNNGVFGMLRKENPKEEKVEWIYQTRYERKSVQMFAQRGWRDPETGTVYITFRSEWDDVPPIIVAATPTTARLAYEYPNLPVHGQSDRFMAIAKPSPDRVVVNAFFGNNVYIFRADVKYPNTEISNLVKIELKKLGLI